MYCPSCRFILYNNFSVIIVRLFSFRFFLEGKLSLICCVIIIQKKENTSRYFCRFFLEGILDCNRYPIGNISSLTLLLFFASFLKENLSYVALSFSYRKTFVTSCFFLEGKSVEVLFAIVIR